MPVVLTPVSSPVKAQKQWLYRDSQSTSRFITLTPAPTHTHTPCCNTPPAPCDSECDVRGLQVLPGLCLVPISPLEKLSLDSIPVVASRQGADPAMQPHAPGPAVRLAGGGS